MLSSANLVKEFPNQFVHGPLVEADGLAFFTGDFDRVWRSDGTTEGTFALRTNGQYVIADTSERVAFHDAFNFPGGSFADELWRTDGTDQGTIKVWDTPAGVRIEKLVTGGETLFLFTKGNSPTNAPPAIWTTDGESAPVMVAELHRPAPNKLFAVGDTLFFTYVTDAGGWELWKSDGTTTGTSLVKGVDTGNYTSPWLFAEFNGMLFFAARDPGHGSELWRSDGTEAGTFRVKDIQAGEGSSSPYRLTEAHGALYFGADDGVHGRELWKSDGTEAGTVQVADIRPNGSASVDVIGLADGNVMLFADDGVHGHELWTSDGTEDGTLLVKDIQLGPKNASVRYPISVGGHLFFTATDGVSGWETWETDGTFAGTRLALDAVPGPNGLGFHRRADIAGRMFLHLESPRISGDELWVVDPSTLLPGDTDADGDVDVTDLNNVRNHFGEANSALGDADGNGVVDIHDLNAVRNNYGFGVPPVAPLVAKRRSSDPIPRKRPTRALLSAATSTRTGQGLLDRTCVINRKHKAVDELFALL